MRRRSSFIERYEARRAAYHARVGSESGSWQRVSEGLGSGAGKSGRRREQSSFTEGEARRAALHARGSEGFSPRQLSELPPADVGGIARRCELIRRRETREEAFHKSAGRSKKWRSMQEAQCDLSRQARDFSHGDTMPGHEVQQVESATENGIPQQNEPPEAEPLSPLQTWKEAENMLMEDFDHEVANHPPPKWFTGSEHWRRLRARTTYSDFYGDWRAGETILRALSPAMTLIHL